MLKLKLKSKLGVEGVIKDGINYFCGWVVGCVGGWVGGWRTGEYC